MQWIDLAGVLDWYAASPRVLMRAVTPLLRPTRSGVIFGSVTGTLITSLSGTFAATIAFLIARYAARDRVLSWAKRNPKFAAIDRAIAKNGFKVANECRHEGDCVYGTARMGLCAWDFAQRTACKGLRAWDCVHWTACRPCVVLGCAPARSALWRAWRACSAAPPPLTCPPNPRRPCSS
jgi:hypothetical protein